MELVPGGWRPARLIKLFRIFEAALAVARVVIIIGRGRRWPGPGWDEGDSVLGQPPDRVLQQRVVNLRSVALVALSPFGDEQVVEQQSWKPRIGKNLNKH